MATFGFPAPEPLHMSGAWRRTGLERADLGRSAPPLVSCGLHLALERQLVQNYLGNGTKHKRTNVR